jgi:hypothetical protein
MKQELEDKLYKAFPDFFFEKDLPITQSCMSWGIETSDGWFQILWDLCEEIKKIEHEGFRFTQIKEKFSELRIYSYNESVEIYELIDKAADKSNKTCERCGSTEEVTQSGSWIKTLCSTCRSKK